MIIIYLLRSILFALCFYINSIVLLFVVIYIKIFKDRDFFESYAKHWAHINVLLLEYICGVKYEVIGSENIVGDRFVAVSKHQSTWECYFLFYYLPGCPICISKKEIIFMPIFGIAMNVLGSIIIDRKGGIHAVKKLIEQSKKFYSAGRTTFLIFPEGTRVPINASADQYPYKPGFLSIAKTNKLDILPITVNSGLIWPKGQFIKKPGKITVKIMPMIKYNDYKNEDKDNIMNNIRNIIENEQKNLPKI